MSNQKTSFLKILKLATMGLFLASFVGFFVLFFTGVLFSFWVILPAFLFLLGIAATVYLCIPTRKPLKKFTSETNEAYQERVEVELAIKQFEQYAQGKIPLEAINVSPESDLYQWLFHSQKAYFSLKVQAEIDRSKESEEEKKVFKEGLQERVMVSLEKSYAASKKLFNEEEDSKKADNKVIFNRLFQRIEEKTSIKRPIYKLEFDGLAQSANVAFKRRSKFVLFGINPDGNCMFYCINIRTRDEMLNLIIKHLDFDQLKYYVFQRILPEKLQEIGRDYNDNELNTWIKEYIEIQKIIKEKLNSKKENEGLSGLQKSSDNLKEKIDAKIKILIPYENNENFAKFIKQYMRELWFTNFIVEELCAAMNNENPEKFRRSAEFGVSCEKKYTLFLNFGGSGYDFVCGKVKESSILKDDILYVWIEDGFFHYQFKNLNGNWIKNKMEEERLKANFHKVKECTGLNLDYDTFIKKLNSDNLIVCEKGDAKAIFLLTIAEKETHGPQPYYYNYFTTGIHASRFVELEDDEELIRGKIHENAYGLCQNQEAYDSYERTWVPG